ncbi:MAG: hypothetical protein GEV12_05630 [Micromonosporaceae bacterium]|nr:hypothetical protein [Micromonosporaceae bacterium]
MRTTNPMLTRLTADAERERAAASAQPQVFGQPAAQPYPTVEGAAPPSVRPMTVDDVVVRTIGLVALVVAAAGAIWLTTEPSDGLAFAFPAMIVGLVLGLVIAFARVTNPFVISAYAVVMGVFLGAISQWFNTVFGGGIVMQAVIATLGVFLLMGLLYKSGVIRATPKFMKFMVAALVGAAAVILINLVITLLTGQPTILRDGGPIAIIVSLVFIVIASLSFILSFHEVEEGVRLGLPERYAWACAFGILVSLIWLYIEVLRLLSYFSGE